MMDLTEYGFTIESRAPAGEGMTLGKAIRKVVSEGMTGWPGHWEISDWDGVGIYIHSENYTPNEDLEISIALRVTGTQIIFMLDHYDDLCEPGTAVVRHAIGYALHPVHEDVVVPGGFDHVLASVLKNGLKKAEGALKREGDEVSVKILKEMETWK